MVDTYKVYVKLDNDNHIKAVNSSAFLNDLSGWTQIDEGVGDKYHHAQGNYLDKPLFNMDGTHNYVLDGTTAREATTAELAAELAEIEAAKPPAQPTELDIIGQQVANLTVKLMKLEGETNV